MSRQDPAVSGQAVSGQAVSGHAAPIDPPEDDGSEGGGRRANRGVWIRAFIYVIGFHIFAGFIMLLFYVGSHRH